MRAGLLHALLQRTSAALTLNGKADPNLRLDFESWANRAVPENEPYYRHDDECPDDPPT